MAKKKFLYYVVRKGYNPGIYRSWEECNNQSPLFESTSSKASQYFKTEAEDFSEYLPLESFCNEPSDQERHYMKFSSFLRMCELLHDNLEYARDIADVHKPMFLLFEGRKGLKRDECESESDDDDNGLLHFDSESHLFNYLGLEKAKSSSIVVAERYFHSTYKLEFASASEGNLGKSGAGILVWRPDDSVACGLMVGLGTMPKAVAEFSALIIGLRASLERGIYHIEVSGKFEWIHELQNYFSDKYVMDLIKEAEDLMNIFKLFIVKHEVNAFISASSLANSAASLPDGCLKKVNENGK